MTAPRLFATAMTLFAAACGGLSNEDLRFLAAFPDKEMALRAPGETSADEPAGVVSTHLVRQRAEFVEHTARVARDINRGVLWVVRLVDQIPRKVAPTTREQDKRVWGPYPSPENEDVELMVVVERHANSSDPFYEWAIRLRRSGGEWLDLFSGDFRGERAAHGSGTLVMEFAHGRALGLEKPGERVPFDRALVSYTLARTGAGRSLDLDVQFQGATGETVDDFGYVYHRAPDGGGRFSFAFEAPVCCGIRPERVEVLVRWAPDARGKPGAGRGDATVSGPDLLVPFTQVECWNEDKETVHYTDSAGVRTPLGDPGACAFGAP